MYQKSINLNSLQEIDHLIIEWFEKPSDVEFY